MSEEDDKDLIKIKTSSKYGMFGRGSTNISTSSLNGVKLDPKDLNVALDKLTTMNLGPPTVGYADAYTTAYNQSSVYDIRHAKTGPDTMKVKGNLVIEDGSGEIDVGDFINSMKERMLILQPNLEAMEEYPALKDAYDQYKMLERLLLDANKKTE